MEAGHLLPASLAIWHRSSPWDISIQKHFCLFWYKMHMQLAPRFFLLSSKLDCKHSAWSCGNRAVTTRERPRELRYQPKPWRCRMTEPKPAAAYPGPCEVRKISTCLFKSFFTQMFCYLYLKTFLHNMKRNREIIEEKFPVKKNLCFQTERTHWIPYLKLILFYTQGINWQIPEFHREKRKSYSLSAETTGSLKEYQANIRFFIFSSWI